MSGSAIYAGAFGIQSAVIRAALNHLIQSPGGQMTKELQARIWDLQPGGIGDWLVMPMNIHDEIQCPSKPHLSHRIKEIVEELQETNDRVKTDHVKNYLKRYLKRLEKDAS